VSELERIAEAAELAPIDLRFADLVARLADGDEARDLLARTAALVSRERGRGHSCVELSRWAGAGLAGRAGTDSAGREAGGRLAAGDGGLFPPLDAWLRALRATSLVGDGSAPTPLVLDAAGRCYLHRYWRAERRIAELARSYAASRCDDADPAALAARFRRLFPASADGNDRQAVAAAAVVRNRITIVSGGPGTGKTSTVAKILALLASAQPRLHVELAAPTGKAAARLTQSVRTQAADLPVDTAVRERIAALEARTIHRLLGVAPGAARFRRRAGRRLVCDLLVVDEASMIDLLLMDALLAAAPPHARILLVGDKDQLASVEAGFVFGDLCEAAARGGSWSASFADHYRILSGRDLPRSSAAAGGEGERPAGLRDNAVELTVGWRFRDRPGIERLAAAIRQSDADAALRVLDDESAADARRCELPADAKSVVRETFESIASVAAAATPAEALERLGRVRMLCATNRGPWSVATLNLLVERELRERGHAASDERWYRGRPILVTQNDYGLDLFNGDVGVCHPDGDGRMRAWFPSAGGVRAIAPAKLPDHVTAWAMTVHKSQGSEFDRVVFVMPERDSPLLTRELLYTAVTRARTHVTVYASAVTLRAAIARRAERTSGLRDLLTGEG
jgi:exodeoxyribonuclease V alpha subunit